VSKSFLRFLVVFGIAGAAALADPGTVVLPSIPPTDALHRYLENMQMQQARLEGARMEVEIDARLPRLKKEGRFQALRRVTRLGRVSYDAVRFMGDKMIKNDVIAKYLHAEAEALSRSMNGQANGKTISMAINDDNYKFKYKGMIGLNGRWLYVYQLTPKKKRLGLFKGELWIDLNTFLPFRESGRMVKNPSVFLKKVEFVRDYEFVDGLALPKRIESRVDTRLVGRAELNIAFNNILPERRAQVRICPMGF